VQAMVNDKVRLDIKYKITNQEGIEQDYPYTPTISHEHTLRLTIDLPNLLDNRLINSN
jgi:hypothetical protein